MPIGVLKISGLRLSLICCSERRGFAGLQVPALLLSERLVIGVAANDFRRFSSDSRRLVNTTLLACRLAVPGVLRMPLCTALGVFSFCVTKTPRWFQLLCNRFTQSYLP